MYAAIDEQPTVRERFAADLVPRGVVARGRSRSLPQSRPGRVPAHPRERPPAPRSGRDRPSRATAAPAPASRRRDRCAPSTGTRSRRSTQALLTLSRGTSRSTRSSSARSQRRRVAFDRPDAPIDWAPRRNAGLRHPAQRRRAGSPHRPGRRPGHLQPAPPDVLRRADRHAVHAARRAARQRASFDVHNSPLSENAALGFEYGYSVQAPDALVLWEGQYGDFINGAQVIVDEFVVSGQAKWGLVSGLVLLLPHAWEGQGRITRAAASNGSSSGRRGQHPGRQLHHRRAVLLSAAPPGAEPRDRRAAADRA